MKFVALLGSPNAAGRTRVVADAIARGIIRANGEIEMISLAGEPSDGLIDACDNADGLLIGCPVYRGGMAYPLKTLLDHMPRGMWGETIAPLLGKSAGIYMTGASLDHYLAVDELRRVLCGFFACQVLAPGLYFSPADFIYDADLSDEANKTASLYGEALMSFGSAILGSEAIQALRPQA
jgi:NAD(P)H-dependent FMN reductase